MNKIKIDDFKLKARLEDDDGVIDTELSKGFENERAVVNDETREATFVISTNQKDRDGDIIHTDGWDFENWLDNPVVLWGHDYSGTPIGTGHSIKVSEDGNKVYATVKFISEGIDPLADRVYRLVKDGVIRTTSVGFRPIEWEFIKDDDSGGIEFFKQELLEFSIVPIPCNPGATIAAGAETKAVLADYAKDMVKWGVDYLKSCDGVECEDVETDEVKTTDTEEVETAEVVVGEDSSETAEVAEVVETESEDMVIIVEDEVDEEDELKAMVADAFKIAFKQVKDETDAYREMKKTGKIGG